MLSSSSTTCSRKTMIASGVFAVVATVAIATAVGIWAFTAPTKSNDSSFGLESECKSGCCHAKTDEVATNSESSFSTDAKEDVTRCCHSKNDGASSCSQSNQGEDGTNSGQPTDANHGASSSSHSDHGEDVAGTGSSCCHFNHGAGADA
uniref:Uncharacterized protein n=1 Tax=Spongospora subterranea TaxID=70186 RepID=A0A0H5RJV3_9EUKA|eukprot:CRZ08999.1 hypothetical protein [Spongospora subterranea]